MTNIVSVTESNNSVTVSSDNNRVTVTDASPTVTVSSPFTKTGSDQVIFQTFTDGSNTAVPDGTASTFSFAATTPITATVNASTDPLTVAATAASTSAKGVASFASSDFAVSSGAGSLVDLTTSHIASGPLDTTLSSVSGSDDTLASAKAIKSYVDTEITDLVGGAPGALDTLNELAAAIGDDSSYASTITTSLATKAPIASPTFTGTVAIPNISNLETAVAANTAKGTNVSTNLSATANGTSLTVASSDGTDASLPLADTDNWGVMSDEMFDKLDGIQASATADQTGAEIKSAYEGESDTNAFTDAEKTKLTNIDVSADVTDATTVNAAGAVMHTDIPDSDTGLVKRTGSETYDIDTSTYITGNQTVTVSGDVTGSGTTAITATLAASGVSAATYGSATQTPVFAVDAKGRVTSVTNTAISAGITEGTAIALAIAL